MIELGDEHGRHAVERGAALGRDGLERRQRIEALGREHHRCAMRDRGEIAQHHAEAVIERHRDADAVARRETHRRAGEVAVVEQVVVGERRAFGRAGGAAGELDIDGVIELERRRQRRLRAAFAVAAHAHHVVEAIEAAALVGANADEGGERRQALGLEPARRAAVEFGRQFAQHADIIARLERIGGDEGAAADLVERIVELGQAIGGVDVDQNEPGLGGRELGHDPFGVVGRPDADALARPETERDEARGQRIDAALQFAIGPVHVLVPHHHRIALGPALGRRVEETADGRADQRDARGAVDVALTQFRHRRSSRARCGLDRPAAAP